MGFHKTLQELRKQKGMTQEELASSLYVSRTAISKWESGRGYPNIESLKALAAFFEVSVDDLLSGQEILTLAGEDAKQRTGRVLDLVFGLLDVCVAMLLFLPLFATKADGVIQSLPLLTLTGVQLYLKIAYYVLVLGSILTGLLILALQNCQIGLWQRSKVLLSLLGSIALVLLLIISAQPYAAVFVFGLLAVKTFLLLKRQ